MVGNLFFHCPRSRLYKGTILKALIFGSNGQDGYYLKALLEQQNIEVVAVSRSCGDFIGNVGDFQFVLNIIKENKPDYIFHFAANSSTRHDVLFENHEAISTGTINILESCKLYCPKARIFLSGSAMQFANSGMPIDEKTPFEASSPYAVARIESVYMGRYYRDVLGLSIYIGYFFNHDSPLRSANHVNQKIAAAVKRIASGSSEKIMLGNIDVEKEFCFAGDIVEAVWLLVNQEKIAEAVLGSGKAYSIKDWLEYCFDKINKNWQQYVLTDKNFNAEYKTLISNPSLIKSIGWEPKVNFHQLADMMMGEKA